MPQTLCPDLYEALRRLYGKVDVGNEGELIRVTDYNPDRGSILSIDSPVRLTASDGEYYKVSCPFCTDTRQRLWVSYAFDRYPWLAVCYNETACMTGPAGASRRAELRWKIREASGPGGINTVSEIASSENEDKPGQVVPVEYPGYGLYVNQLPSNHQVRWYLEQKRKYDVDMLSRDYGVGALTSVSPEHPQWIADRVFVPIIMNKQLVGWQARYPDDLNWKEAGITKYYNLPRMPKAGMLYGYDSALDWSFVNIVEGCSDVWGVGPPTVGILGSSITRLQAMLLTSHWEKLFLYLDGETALPPKDRPNDTPPRQKAVEKLLPFLKPNQTLVVVPLPVGTDPGGLERAINRQNIRTAAESAGIHLDPAWR
jgi:hypothetical protein